MASAPRPLRQKDIANAGTEVAAAINGPESDTPTTARASRDRCVPLSRAGPRPDSSTSMSPSSPVGLRCGTLHLVADTGQAADELSQRAILDEALKKGALVWVQVAERSHARWHAWIGGHVYLLTGPGEQPDPGLASRDAALVVVRSKDNRHRLVAFDAEVSRVSPDDADWAAATAELARLRLNLSDA